MSSDWIEAWIRRVLHRRRVVLAAATAVALLAAPLVALRLGLNTDEEALFAADAGYVAARAEFRRAFPALLDPVVVVIDATTLDAADAAAGQLAARLRQAPELFPSVHEPEGGSFFEEHGLLYLETEELEDALDRLVEAQPYVGALGADPSLRGLAEVLGDAAAATASGDLERFELVSVFDSVEAVIAADLAGRARSLSWAELLLGASFADVERRRRVLLVQPVVDYGALEPAGRTLSALRSAVAELGLEADPEVRVRLSGLFALSQEETALVADQAALAGLASFALVALLLLFGLRSWRAALAVLTTLVVGLLVTAGFATLAVGHLNLISVAFAVLFIGLSVDFGIHLVVAASEQRGAEASVEEALARAGAQVGGSLVVCAATTAIGFYAFLFTDFLGVAELGLIAGTGMLVSLATNLTLLPALLATFPKGVVPPRSFGGTGLLRWPLRHARSVVAAGALAALGASLLAPRVHFDANPLRVRDPSAESVQAFDDLLAEGRAFPWNVNVLASDRDAAAVARQLEALPEVDRTLALDGYVPELQDEKLALLDDAAFLLLPSLQREPGAPPRPGEQRAALERLARELAPLGSSPDTALARSAARLRATLLRWLETRDAAAAAALEGRLLGSLPTRLASLERALQPARVTEDSLPQDLRTLLVAPDGRRRVEVFPSEDLGDDVALRRYVDAVRTVAPDSFGEAIVIHEVGRTVVRAFRQALATAGILIACVLLLFWRSLRDAALAAVPIALAALLTAAATVLLGMSLNFANVIVIPLLLGMGVDTGVHLVHRIRGGRLPGGNLLETATARAVLLSALTTAASFGTLGFSTHRGMASLGQLLAIGIALILLCNLVLLPALVVLVDRRGRR